MTAARLSSAAVATVARDVPLLRGLRPLSPAFSVCGPAATCRCAPDDNLALHLLLATAAPGSVLVCDAGGRDDTGSFGELMALDALGRGLAGLVLDGAVRDGAALLVSGFPVFHRGFAPFPCSKSSSPSVGEPIVVGDVRVAPGDMVVADCDGVLVVSRGRWAEVAHRARALAHEEDAIRAALARGERLAGLIGLEGSA